MKYLFVCRNDIVIRKTLGAVREKNKLTISESMSESESSQIIVVDPKEINDVLVMFPDVPFHGVYSSSESMEEDYAEFKLTVENMNNGKCPWHENLKLFQKLEDGEELDYEKLADELYNTFILHEQLCKITKKLISVTVLSVQGEKIKQYYYDYLTDTETMKLESVDTFAYSLIFDNEGFERVMKQWLCIVYPDL